MSGGRILNPFCESGTTVLAAVQESHEAVGIEVTDAYYKLGSDRVRFALKDPNEKRKLQNIARQKPERSMMSNPLQIELAAKQALCCKRDPLHS